jgi:hypothetical protein
MFIRSRSLGCGTPAWTVWRGSPPPPSSPPAYFPGGNVGAWRALPSSSCAVEELARRPAGLDFGTSSWATSRDSSHSREKTSHNRRPCKHSDARMGKERSSCSSSRSKERRAGCRSARAPLRVPRGRRCGCGWCRRSRDDWTGVGQSHQVGGVTDDRTAVWLFMYAVVSIQVDIEERQTDGQTNVEQYRGMSIYCLRVRLSVYSY